MPAISASLRLPRDFCGLVVIPLLFQGLLGAILLIIQLVQASVCLVLFCLPFLLGSAFRMIGLVIVVVLFALQGVFSRFPLLIEVFVSCIFRPIIVLLITVSRSLLRPRSLWAHRPGHKFSVFSSHSFRPRFQGGCDTGVGGEAYR